MNKLWKSLTGGLIVALIMLGAVSAFSESKSAPTMEVYKSATCGCCKKWVDHLTQNGFKVNAHDVTNLNAIKAKYGVPNGFTSCHTGVVDGYVIEGHVPASVVQRFLKERPKVAGLTVPGMPIGSPGMEGSHRESYEVLTFDSKGKTEVYEFIQGDK